MGQLREPVELLKRPEDKTLEFKRDLASPAGVLCSIVAFANTARGTLLIGVEDKSRRVRGVKDTLASEVRGRVPVKTKAPDRSTRTGALLHGTAGIPQSS